MRFRLCHSLLGVLCFWVAVSSFAAVEPAQHVLIVYNTEEPESRPLADYYARKRGVPTNQICGISIRNVETITRREFNDLVREPVLRSLTRYGLMVQQPRMIEDPDRKSVV